MNESNRSAKTIAIFLPSLCCGGVERMRLHLAQQFLNKGYEVEILLAKGEGPYIDVVPNGAKLIVLNKERVLKCLPALVQYLRQKRPISILSAMEHSNIIVILAKILARVPTKVVISVHTNLEVSLSAKNSEIYLICILAKWLYKKANHIIAVSDGVASCIVSILKIQKEKIIVINNPVVSSEIYELMDESVNHEWFQSDSSAVILSVGRLTAAKDYPTLIKAFSIVYNVTNCKLVIIGDGEERENLGRLIKNLGLEKVISLPGSVLNPYPYMARAKVYVLSSAWEGFGNSLVEAMALGTGVVATDCKFGPSEILDDGKYGRLVSVGDFYTLAEKILDELNKPTCANLLRRRAEKYRCEDIATQYLELLDDNLQF